MLRLLMYSWTCNRYDAVILEGFQSFFTFILIIKNAIGAFIWRNITNVVPETNAKISICYRSITLVNYLCPMWETNAT